MKIKIIGKAQVIFQAQARDPSGKAQEYKLELDLPAPAQWAPTYVTAVNLFLNQARDVFSGMEWPGQ